MNFQSAEAGLPRRAAITMLMSISPRLDLGTLSESDAICGLMGLNELL